MLPAKRKFGRATTNAGSRSFPLAPGSSIAIGSLSSSSAATHPVQGEASTSSTLAADASASESPFPPRAFKRSRTEPVPVAAPVVPQKNTLSALPIEDKHKILDNLSLPDAMALVQALPELRVRFHNENWSPWRKRWHALINAERSYDQLLYRENEEKRRQSYNPSSSQQLPSQTQAQSQFQSASQLNSDKTRSREEQTLGTQYRNALIALNLSRPPSSLDELILALDLCSNTANGRNTGALSNVPSDYMREYGRSLILGPGYSPKFANAPFCAFNHLEHAAASELISCVGTFLSVLRISVLVGEQKHGSTTRTARYLEADCRDALDRFFRPRIYIPPPGSASRLTSEQRDFVDTDVFQGEVIKIQAYAGTGKTTSLLEYAKERPHRRFLYLAFNKAAQEDAHKRFSSNVECRTFHSFAYGSRPANCQVGNIRNSDIVTRHLLDQLPEGEKKPTPGEQVRPNAKDRKLLPTTVASYIMAVLEKFMSSDAQEISVDHVPWRMKDKTTLSVQEVVDSAAKLWEYIKKGKDRRGYPVKCPHDAYIKLLQLRGPLYPDPLVGRDVLLIDEAQDMSLCQIDILKRMFPQWGGVIIVGDTHQKIYDFRGATDKLFDDDFIKPTHSFRLTQSFRFGEKIAEAATTIVRLKALPSWAKNQTKPRLSGMKTWTDHLYWANDSGSDAMEERVGAIPSQLIWPYSSSIDANGSTPETTMTDAETVGNDAAIEDDMQYGSAENEQDEDEMLMTDSEDEGSTDVSASGGAAGDFRPVKHTRIYRTNARLLRDAMKLAVLSREAGRRTKVFLKTNATLNKGALINLLKDAYELYHGRRPEKVFALKEFSSWEELQQRVEAEEGGSSSANSMLGLVLGLKSLLSSPTWLDEVKELEAQFVEREDEALIVMATVHQAKGLEWDRVMLGDDFRPVLLGETVRDIEFNQLYFQNEINLMYVAATRAKKELYLSRTFVQWLCVINGLSRFEVDYARTGEACLNCEGKDKLFLRRTVRIARKDPLWISSLTPTGSNDGAPSTILSPEWCTDCITAALPAASFDDNVAVSDFVDTVSAIKSLQAKIASDKAAAQAAPEAYHPTPYGNGASSMVPVSAGANGDDAVPAENVPDAAAGSDAVRFKDSDIPLLKIASARRDALWEMRLAVEKVALVVEMKACSCRPTVPVAPTQD
ncbi:hypothetical protein CF319_g5879 [Tilletia indica]|nr:hypothetical protein CF319_g5879 [Tilletia indica]